MGKLFHMEFISNARIIEHMSFKIVVLENALTTWDQPETRLLLNDIVTLKVEGYGRAFNDPLLVIPLDVFEFVGTHILLYHNDKLVMGYKTVFLHDCKKMNLEFPLEKHIRSGGQDIHREKYFDFMEKNADKRIAYDCHLTVSDSTAKNPELLHQCLSILYAMVYHTRHTYNADFSFMIGTYFAGTHKTFAKMGTKIFHNLGPIVFSAYDKREALVMICDKSFSLKAIELAREYLPLWENRKVINASTKINQQKKVA